MKKLFFLPFFTAVVLAGCTTPEQDQQIRLFWLQQYQALIQKQLAAQIQSLSKDPRFQGMDFNKLMSAMPAMPAQNTASVAAPATPAEQTAKRRPAPQPQIMDVTLDTDALPGKAPHADRVKMKKALEAVQAANQTTLVDIATAFGDKVKYQAFLQMTQTEKQLKQAASTSPSFAAYQATQTKLLAAQETQLNELMRQNAGKLKALRQ